VLGVRAGEIAGRNASNDLSKSLAVTVSGNCEGNERDTGRGCPIVAIAGVAGNGQGKVGVGVGGRACGCELAVLAEFKYGRLGPEDQRCKEGYYKQGNNKRTLHIFLLPRLGILKLLS